MLKTKTVTIGEYEYAISQWTHMQERNWMNQSRLGHITTQLHRYNTMWDIAMQKHDEIALNRLSALIDKTNEDYAQVIDAANIGRMAMTVTVKKDGQDVKTDADFFSNLSNSDYDQLLNEMYTFQKGMPDNPYADAYERFMVWLEGNRGQKIDVDDVITKYTDLIQLELTGELKKK